MTTFYDLGLSVPVRKAIAELGFETPTDIQIRTIPELLSKPRDFIGLAQTGTGKTAAFGLPLLELLDPEADYTQGLILAPTRELGQQIATQLAAYGKYMSQVHTLAVYGGAAISNQIKALKKTQHVIIATPGRLIDLIKRKAVKLNRLQFLVLDEADEMLNMGFKEELDEILKYAPEEKHVWLFSATMPKEIRRIVSTYMHDPLEVRVNTKNEVNVNIEHRYAVVKGSDKPEALTRFIDVAPEMRSVVFCRTKRETQSLAEELLKKDYKADAIHGDLSQPQRDRVMKRFKSHELQVLIATDVAARGIDVNDLTHVFHFSLPDDPSYYTHRSGRTARAGKSGMSVAFIGGREKGRLEHMAKQLGISFEHLEIPQVNHVREQRVERWCQEVLETKSRRLADPALLEKVQLIFGKLSKEELVAKLVAHELEALNTETNKDLNLRLQKQGGKGKSKSGRARYGSGKKPFKKKHKKGKRGSYKRY